MIPYINRTFNHCGLAITVWKLSLVKLLNCLSFQPLPNSSSISFQETIQLFPG